jgi:hypothetical protein
VNGQTELNFNSTVQNDALLAWREQRKQAHIALARKIGLPLDHKVELWLRGGIRLRGMLRMKENLLLVPEDDAPDMAFEVGNVPFLIEEMESCVRLD